VSAASEVPQDPKEFRRQVRDLLQRSGSDRDPWQYFRDRSGAKNLYLELGRRGWLSISWPVSEGGLGRTLDFEFTLWDEMAYARAAKPPIGAAIVAHSIMGHATAEQKARFLPGIARGEITFSLGYSEPEAGSDLTGLRAHARRDGDKYVVSGEKRWTSDAHHADLLWLLCRTGALESRARGLSLLIVDLPSPNIEIRPIMTLDGHRVNEVRLNEVVVPVGNRIGDENGAWKIIQEALAQERHLQVLPGRLRRDMDDLIEWARTSGVLGDDAARRELALFAAGVDAVSESARLIVESMIRGDDPSTLAACQKIVGTHLMQEIARFPLEHGDSGQLVTGSPFEFLWRECVLETVAGGTSEVMAGMVARRALGLWA
jgi:alkylation response protein AidB-like acyl-CoA dehydrogenase